MRFTKEQLSEAILSAYVRTKVWTEGEYDDVKETIDALEAEQRAALELGPCRKHPKMFWVDQPGMEIRINNDPSLAKAGHCSACTEIAAAYERGKRDSAACVGNLILYNTRQEECSDRLAKSILALQDRGARFGP